MITIHYTIVRTIVQNPTLNLVWFAVIVFRPWTDQTIMMPKGEPMQALEISGFEYDDPMTSIFRRPPLNPSKLARFHRRGYCIAGSRGLNHAA